jgi:hypothetical protein
MGTYITEMHGFPALTRLLGGSIGSKLPLNSATSKTNNYWVAQVLTSASGVGLARWTFAV